MIEMSLTILRTEWWKEKLFRKNKIIEELPERTEKFKQIKSEIEKAITLQLNGGWEITEEEKKIQDEFLPKLFKEMTAGKEASKGIQITILEPRNKSEAVEILEKINSNFPGIIENFVKSKKISEKRKKGIETLENVSSIYQDIKRMHRDIERKHREMMEVSTQTYSGGKNHNKKTGKKDFNTSEKKEKMGIFDIIHPLTKEEYKRLPLTFRDLFEKFWADKIYGLPRKIRSEEIKVYFLETLKRFRRYAPSYKERNKQDIDNMLVRMLEKPDLQEEKEIIDIIKECRELVKIESKS